MAVRDRSHHGGVTECRAGLIGSINSLYGYNSAADRNRPSPQKCRDMAAVAELGKLYSLWTADQEAADNEAVDDDYRRWSCPTMGMPDDRDA